MVKFGKHRFKAFNKILKREKEIKTVMGSNKIMKRKLNRDKKVDFQANVITKEAETVPWSRMVGNNSIQTALLGDCLGSKKPLKKKKIEEEPEQQRKAKPVEKKKKRQKAHISDTKLLLKLMKNK